MTQKPNGSYQIVMSEESYQKILTYKKNLVNNQLKAGEYLKDKLSSVNLTTLPLIQFINKLLSTKKACIFAESDVKCNGSDWNELEFSILGDINVTMAVNAYDNGEWKSCDCIKYDETYQLNLLFSPGALLNNDATGIHNPDYKEIIDCNMELNQEKYNQIIKRRLLPLFWYVNMNSGINKALIVLPGIGCGQFAGRFRGKIQSRLEKGIEALLETYDFGNIFAVQVGFHGLKFGLKRKIIRNVIYEVRGNGLPQLSKSEVYGEEFKGCKVFKVVAWDHVSLPGNDFFHHNSRFTDDGVAAAATNSMEIITGVKGEYKNGKYLPPGNYKDWEEVVEKNGIHLIANESNLLIYSNDGKLYHINDEKGNN